ncbi:MAG TPA: hypothetical protein QF753_01375 [Victivallales bacterium]|nr:hypothetical protein [Victivallales bacterium]
MNYCSILLRHKIKMTLYTLVFICTASFITGCFIPTKPTKLQYAYDMYGLNFNPKNKLYLAHNIWYENPMDISSINYQTGKIIPLGTEIKFIEARRGFITFKTVENNKEYKIVNDVDWSSTPDKVMFHRIFTSKDPLLKFKDTPKQILDDMKKGIIAVGMTREEIYGALGHGPHFLNPKSQQTWTYLVNKGLKTIHVVFKNNKVSYIFTN